jgi:hypothetical protein
MELCNQKACAKENSILCFDLQHSVAKKKFGCSELVPVDDMI